MKVTRAYYTWPREVSWSTQISAAADLLSRRGYEEVDVGSALRKLRAGPLLSYEASTHPQFVEVLSRYPGVQQFDWAFRGRKSDGDAATLIEMSISYLGDRVSITIGGDDVDLVEGLHQSLAAQLGLGNPASPVKDRGRALYLQPTVFVGRHFDSEGDAAFGPLAEFLSLLGFDVLQGKEYASTDIPEKVCKLIDKQDIFIGLITGEADAPWLQAEPAYAKGKGKHIILMADSSAKYNPTILGMDLEQIRFPRGQVEKGFSPLLRELLDIRVRGL